MRPGPIETGGTGSSVKHVVPTEPARSRFPRKGLMMWAFPEAGGHVQ